MRAREVGWEPRASEHALALIARWGELQEEEREGGCAPELETWERVSLPPNALKQLRAQREMEREGEQGLADSRLAQMAEEIESGITRALAESDLYSAACLALALAESYSRAGLAGPAAGSARLGLEHAMSWKAEVELILEELSDEQMVGTRYPEGLPRSTREESLEDAIIRAAGRERLSALGQANQEVCVSAMLWLGERRKERRTLSAAERAEVEKQIELLWHLTPLDTLTSMERCLHACYYGYLLLAQDAPGFHPLLRRGWRKQAARMSAYSYYASGNRGLYEGSPASQVEDWKKMMSAILIGFRFREGARFRD